MSVTMSTSALLKARVKSSKSVVRARVAVRLERDDDAAVEAALRGVERRLDLGRVVAVVVDEHDVALLPSRSMAAADDGEAALHAVEASRAPRATTSSGTSSSSATAMTASALSTLCVPGMRTVNVAERLAATVRLEVRRRARGTGCSSRGSRPARETP